jgi:hypothetical protein
LLNSWQSCCSFLFPQNFRKRTTSAPSWRLLDSHNGLWRFGFLHCWCSTLFFFAGCIPGFALLSVLLGIASRVIVTRLIIGVACISLKNEVKVVGLSLVELTGRIPS